MKVLFIITMFLANTTVGIWQYADSLKQRSAGDYLEKSRKQKSGAVALTVAGTIGIAVSFLGGMNQIGPAFADAFFSPDTDKPKHDYSMVPLVLSVAAVVGSIPLYVKAAKSKQMYHKLSVHVKLEERSVLEQHTINPVTYPAVALKVHF